MTENTRAEPAALSGLDNHVTVEATFLRRDVA